MQEVNENLDIANESDESECAIKNDVAEMFEESEHLDKPIEAKKTDKLICLKIHERIYAFIVLEDRCESFRPW